MKKELFEELLQSVNEAAAIEKGRAKPARTFEVKTANDVVRVRAKLGLSQTKFARLLGISENTLQTARGATPPLRHRLPVCRRIGFRAAITLLEHLRTGPAGVHREIAAKAIESRIIRLRNHHNAQPAQLNLHK